MTDTIYFLSSRTFKNLSQKFLLWGFTELLILFMIPSGQIRQPAECCAGKLSEALNVISSFAFLKNILLSVQR